MNAATQTLRHAGLASSQRRRVLTFLSVSTLLIAASAVPLRVLGEERDAELARFASRGYESATPTTTETSRDVWKHGTDEIIIDLLLPSSVTQAPLVIYMPGLGEPVEAGEKWRIGWAQAGYAVASMQTVGSAALWSTSAGRNGDFKRAASEQFAVKSPRTPELRFAGNCPSFANRRPSLWPDRHRPRGRCRLRSRRANSAGRCGRKAPGHGESADHAGFARSNRTQSPSDPSKRRVRRAFRCHSSADAHRDWHGGR